MTKGRGVSILVGVALLALLAWGMTAALERLARPEPAPVAAAAPAPAAETPHISATLFYATQEGDALVAIRREVPLAEGIVDQGREIVAAQLGPAPEPYLSPIPPGTTLRASARHPARADHDRRPRGRHAGRARGHPPSTDARHVHRARGRRGDALSRSALQ
jgi:hypothetical protein